MVPDAVSLTPRAAVPTRPPLLLYTARYACPHKNAIAATLAWLAEEQGMAFDVYYDAAHSGLHYGGGNPQRVDAGLLTGGLVSGGRHLETGAQVLQRYETTAICSGHVTLAPLLAALGPASGASLYQIPEHDVIMLYDTLLSAWKKNWPEVAVLLKATPSPRLAGIDAYCWPEIFFRRAIGLESCAGPAELAALYDRGIREIWTCGIDPDRQELLSRAGFVVRDTDLVRQGDDYAAVTERLAGRWRDRHEGWMIGDPVLAAYWLPTACRERRAIVYSIPQARILELLAKDIATNTKPVLGRQYEDDDFFTLSRLGQSFQLIDPCRPPLPVSQRAGVCWAQDGPDPRQAEPDDEQLRSYARQGRILVSLVFWSGMIRETENLYALMDLIAMTRLAAGLALTVQSLAHRPPVLDLITVPHDQGGVFPLVELLLASCGTGAAIESLLTPDQLYGHLRAAQCALEQLGVPPRWRPDGWWATMDAPLVPRRSAWLGLPVSRTSSPPYLQIRYQRRSEDADAREPGPQTHEPVQPDRRRHQLIQAARRHLGPAVRSSRLRSLFEPYRPYEHYAPGPLSPQLAAVVQRAGFSYMLSKSGFGEPPRALYRDGDFIALNYTAGRWDGWTPFETINHVSDLRQGERRLLASRRPGWLLGSIDTCLWAFSGALWDAAPGLAAIARYAASGGDSGQLLNVTPRVLARYARLLSA